MDDAQAIEKCRSGEGIAFATLVKRYQAEALAHALALLGQREDAADAVQEAFVEAYRGLTGFDTARAFYPWFYVLLRRRCFKMLCARQRRPASIESQRLALVVSREQAGQADLEEALWSLKSEDREIVMLKHFDGLTYGELAERLEIPIGTVMSRLFTARRRLLALLLPENEEVRHER